MELGIGIKLDKTQKIIFLMALIVVVCITVFWLFIYNPAKAKMRRLKEEFNVIQSEIERIERVSGGEKNLDIAYEKFYKRFLSLEERIPTDERSTLSLLSTEADRMDIEVSVIKPGKAKKGDLSISIDGRSLSEMPISMDIKCDYVTLGEYLNVLREELPTLISVDKVSINRAGARDASNLNIGLNVILYMLTE